MLALTPRVPVSFDHLVDELWAEKRIANARNALQANAGRLRKILEALTGHRGDELVRTVRGGYLLDVADDAVDAHRFHTLADRGAELLDRDPVEADRLLQLALGLWRGPALHDVCDGLRLRIEAANLDERRLTVYEDLVTAKLAVGAERSALSELKQLAAEHPERERLSELLMLVLYHDGRQTEALEVFHGTRRRLAGEFGLTPGRALHRAYQAILTQDERLGEPRSSRLRDSRASWAGRAASRAGATART